MFIPLNSVRVSVGDLLRPDVQEVHSVQRPPLEQGEPNPGPSLAAPEAKFSQGTEPGLLQVAALQVWFGTTFFDGNYKNTNYCIGLAQTIFSYFFFQNSENKAV